MVYPINGHSSHTCRSIFCALLMAGVLALLSVPVQAQCSTSWDVSGEVLIFQKGFPDPIILTLQQKGRVISGRAHQEIATGNFGLATKGGLVDGTIDGDRFSIQIFWSSNQVGIYNAQVAASGRLDGSAYEKSTPKITYTWFSGGVLKCAPPPPPVTPKPIKSTGKARPVAVTTPERKAEPPPTLKPPAIVSSQAVFTRPTQSTGFVILQWDAGPEHPYAEVWYKVDGSDPIFLLEKGKGGMQAPVVRYKTYVYILTDAGKTLATATLVAQ